MSKTLSIRLPDDVADWLENEANQRGRTKTDLIVSLIKAAQEGVQDTATQMQDTATQMQDTAIQSAISAALAPVLDRLSALEK